MDDAPQTDDPRIQPVAEWMRSWNYVRDGIEREEAGRLGWLSYRDDAIAVLVVVDKLSA